MAVTPASFKIAKPQFADVDDQTVQAYLDLGALFVDVSWATSSQDPATIAMTCHLMTLDGLGTDPLAIAIAAGTAAYQTIRSGEITLTRFKAVAESGTAYGDWLAQTACGRMYAVLLRMNKAGPRVATVSGCGPSGFAKDHCGPVYGWPGIFW